MQEGKKDVGRRALLRKHPAKQGTRQRGDLQLSPCVGLTGRFFLVINAPDTAINGQDKSITEHTDYSSFCIVTCLNKTHKN